MINSKNYNYTPKSIKQERFEFNCKIGEANETNLNSKNIISTKVKISPKNSIKTNPSSTAISYPILTTNNSDNNQTELKEQSLSNYCNNPFTLENNFQEAVQTLEINTEEQNNFSCHNTNRLDQDNNDIDKIKPNKQDNSELRLKKYGMIFDFINNNIKEIANLMISNKNTDNISNNIKEYYETIYADKIINCLEVESPKDQIVKVIKMNSLKFKNEDINPDAFLATPYNEVNLSESIVFSSLHSSKLRNILEDTVLHCKENNKISLCSFIQNNNLFDNLDQTEYQYDLNFKNNIESSSVMIETDLDEGNIADVPNSDFM